MIKKTISLLLVFFMTFTIAIPSNAYGLETEYDELTEKLGQLLDENGLAAGNSGGSFNPDGNATRAEFVTMANNLFEFSEISDINFADVNANDWYYPEVQKAFNAGYTVGVKETMFAPNDDLTREQAAVMISRIMKLESDTAAADVFTDKSQISNWALGLVGAAAKAEIFKGCDDNSFKPQNPITVAEAVIVFDRVRIKIDESVDDTNETDTTSSNSSSSSSSSNSSNSSNKVSVTAVAVSTTASSIYVGQIITLTSTVNPTNATNKTIVWSVTNGTGNASIDSSTGLLTAIEVGTVTVTATNTNSGVSGTMEVTITVEPDIVFGSIEQDPGHTGGDVLAEVSRDKVTFTGEIEWYAADEDLGRAEGNRVGVQITAPTELDTSNAKVTIGETTYNWDDIKDEDNYFWYYPLVTDDNKIFTVTVKWNEISTQEFTIDASDTTLQTME